jgi:SAM-dependent methyltransferase
MELLRRLARAAGVEPGRRALRRAFEEIYRTRAWPGSESVSGPGSGVARTALIRAELQALLRELGVRSLLDAGCGDFNWMRETELPGCRYIGVDVVPELIARNRTRHGGAGREFLAADITRDRLPAVDLILCRDCLVHLSLDDALRALAAFRRSGSRYLLATTFVERTENPDIPTGDWRPLNLERTPFGLPVPLRTIDERAPVEHGPNPDKRLALWRLAEG